MLTPFVSDKACIKKNSEKKTKLVFFVLFVFVVVVVAVAFLARAHDFK